MTYVKFSVFLEILVSILSLFLSLIIPAAISIILIKKVIEITMQVKGNVYWVNNLKFSAIAFHYTDSGAADWIHSTRVQTGSVACIQG